MYRDTLSINTQTKPRKTKQVDPAPSYEFIMFYNGECPFCQKEIAWLQSLNRQGRLGLYDIHGMYPDGRMVPGVEVFLCRLSCRALRLVKGTNTLASVKVGLYVWVCFFCTPSIAMGALPRSSLYDRKLLSEVSGY